MKMQEIRILAWDFAVRCGFCRLPVRLEDLLGVARFQGWDVFSYHEGEQALAALHLTEYAQELSAFTIIDQANCVIFYRDELDYSDKLFTIAHEMGHIVLGHTYYGKLGKRNGRSVDVQEQEADIFAYELLAPSCVVRQCRVTSALELRYMGIGSRAEFYFLQILSQSREIHCLERKKLLNQFRQYIREYLKEKRANAAPSDSPHWGQRLIAIGLTASIAFLGFCFVYQMNHWQEDAPVTVIRSQGIAARESSGEQTLETGSFDASMTQDGASSVVYVTSSGKKYHRAECTYVEGKDNLIEMTREEAEEEGYEPCSVCNP